MITEFFTSNFWATCMTVASITTVVASFINNKLLPNKIWKLFIAWTLSIILTIGCYFLGLITVASPAWLTLILTGIVVGISSNGLYDIPTIKEYVNKFAVYAMSIKATQTQDTTETTK